MAGETDKTAGKVKEKFGSATGNEELEQEGRGQHAGGKVQEAVQDAKDKATGLAQGIKDAVTGDRK